MILHASAWDTMHCAKCDYPCYCDHMLIIAFLNPQRKDLIPAAAYSVCWSCFATSAWFMSLVLFDWCSSMSFLADLPCILYVCKLVCRFYEVQFDWADMYDIAEHIGIRSCYAAARLWYTMLRWSSSAVLPRVLLGLTPANITVISSLQQCTNRLVTCTAGTAFNDGVDDWKFWQMPAFDYPGLLLQVGMQ